MPKFYRALAPIAICLTLTAGSTALYAAAQDPGDKVVATINGQPVTERDLDTYARQRSGGHGTNSVERQTLLNEIITRELLYQKAVASGFDKDPQVAAIIKQETHNLLANEVVQALVSGRQPTENELKASYRAHLKKMSNTEYHASHILLKTKAEADSVIAQLNKGADFATLAKEKSIGPSGKQGGDLGWFSPDNMVKPFAEATAKLTVGTYTKSPVHTRFGWHVIKLAGTRKVDPPTFDDMKEQLINDWRSKMIQAYINRLRDKADVKINH